MKRPLRWLTLTLLAAAVGGCTCGGWHVTEEVTPWFRIEEREPYLELPHLLRVGEQGRRASVLRGAFWEAEDIGGRWGTARPFAGASRVLVRDGRSGWRVYRQKEQDAVALETKRCADDPVILTDRTTLLCTACRAPAGHDARCTGLDVSLFDADGALVRQGAPALPEDVGGCRLVQVRTEGLWGDNAAAVSARLDCEVAASGVRPMVRRDALWSVTPERVRTVVPMDRAESCLSGADWRGCLSTDEILQQQ